MSAPEDPRIWQGLRAHLDELGSLPAPPSIGVAIDRPRHRRPSPGLVGLVGSGALLLVIGLFLAAKRPVTTPIAGATPPPSISLAATAAAAPVDMGQLIGRSYVAISASRGGEPIALVPDAPLALGFTDTSHFGASFGCNGGGGDYEIRDGRLVTADVYMTAMGCLGARGELESWYYQFLLSGPVISREGSGFVLTSGDVVVTYGDTSPKIETDCPGGSVAVGSPPESPEFLAVVRAVHRDPDNFGEIYVDPTGIVVIQYVGDNAGRPAVEEEIPGDMEVVWRQVRHSRTELRRIQDEITERRLPGVYWTGSGNACNAVKVGVDEHSIDEIGQLLADNYGDAVYVVPSEPIIAW
jgi:hypothetical protein